MNILNEVNAFLLARLTPYSTIYKDVFPNDSIEELMSRNDPGQAAETRYMDGSRVGTFNFSYYAKSANSETARIQLEAIVAALDFKELTVISGGTAIRLEAATTPAFVSKSEAGEVIFVTSLRLEYHTGG
jgi:hypothetical protein